MKLTSLLSPLKRSIWGTETKPRRILWGAARGITIDINPIGKIQRQIGLDEREIQADFVHTARWADVLVDIGASDGYYSLIFHRYNPAGEVIMIDGDASFAPIQHRHFKFNFPGFHPRTLSKYVAPADAQNENTCCLTTDLALGGRRVFFKIDVDGWEFDVIKSAADLFDHAEVRFLVETHSVHLEKDCLAFLQSAGFETRIIDNAWWRTFIPEQRPLELNRWFYAAKATI